MQELNLSQNEELDRLAFQYAQSKREEDLSALINKMRPICKKDAIVWSLRTSVPQHDLESAYLESVQQAAESYEPIGEFIKRYHYYKNRRGSDVLKYHRAQKRNSFQTISLNNKLKDEEGAEEFGDRLPDRASDFTRVLEILETIEEFENKNPKYGNIIKMLSCGEHKNNIAHFLGETKYGDLARKHVSLARKQFREFMSKN